MPNVQSIADFLARYAPAELAEDWDNVGLLVGDPAREVRRVMTCLTVTSTTAAEAVRQGAQLIVTHHPMPFRPLKRLTTETTVGRLLLELIASRIAVYSPHTSFDSAEEGINQRLAAGLQLEEIAPLLPGEGPLGAGRFGSLKEPLPLEALASRVKEFLSIGQLQLVGDPARPIQSVAVACGAAGEFLEPAHQAGCDAMLLGETTFHTCLEAEALEISLILPGHFASERFAVECLAEVLAAQFPETEVWPAHDERDPLRWL